MWRPVEDDREVRGNAIMRMRVGFNTEVTAFDIVNYGPFYTEEGVGKEQRANVRKVHDALSRYFMERRSVGPSRDAPRERVSPRSLTHHQRR